MPKPDLWVLDRFEDGRTAVLVSTRGEERAVPRSRLPPEAREGDALRPLVDPEEDGEGRAGVAGRHEGAESGDASAFALDREATERLRKEAEALRSSLRRGPSGPLSL